MSTPVKVTALVVLSVMQVCAAAWSIVRYERTLASGTPYRIRIEPIDPADPFRGRYVAVQPTITLPTPIAPETELLLQSVQSRSGTAYVRLTNDSEGFAAAARILSEPPPEGDYLEIDGAWPVWTSPPERPHQPEMTGYTLRFSFDRYYMNETAAPAAEQAYFERTRRNADSKAWLTVKVMNGVGVIAGLFVDGVPIEELVR